MNKGTHHRAQGQARQRRHRGEAQLCVWYVVATMGLFFGGRASAANAPPPLPGPAAPITSARIWPPAVYLGQRFEYRMTLRANAGLRPVQPKRIQFGRKRLPSILQAEGPIRLQGPLQIQQRQGSQVIKIPLAIYIVRQYGPQKLPPFALTFRSAQGEQTLWLPGKTFEVRARYAATRRFRMRTDPTLPFESTKAQRQPSHEWRSLPLPPTKGGEQWPLSWILGACSVFLALLMWGFVMWQRRRPTDEEESIAPIDTAKQQLMALQRAPVLEREQLRQRYTQMLQILRDYLQQRLPAPTRHLTAQELCRFFTEEPPPAQALTYPPPWFGELQQLLKESEGVCFGPPAPLPRQSELLPTQIQQSLRLLDIVEAWQTQRDEEEAQAQTALADAAREETDVAF